MDESSYIGSLLSFKWDGNYFILNYVLIAKSCSQWRNSGRSSMVEVKLLPMLTETKVVDQATL